MQTNIPTPGNIETNSSGADFRSRPNAKNSTKKMNPTVA